jgi:hypothetical protein
MAKQKIRGNRIGGFEMKVRSFPFFVGPTVGNLFLILVYPVYFCLSADRQVAQ